MTTKYLYYSYLLWLIIVTTAHIYEVHLWLKKKKRKEKKRNEGNLPRGILPVPWQVGQVTLSLPVNSTYGNCDTSPHLPSSPCDSE